MTHAKQRFLAAIALAFIVGCQVKAPPEAGEQPGVGSTTVVTTAFDVGSYTGKVLLLDFWATWCPPCRSEIPAINQLYQDFKDKDVAIIGMSLDQGEPEKIQASVRKLGIAYPVVLADEQVQEKFGGIRAVPTKFVIDKKGNVRKTFVGVVPANEIRDQITALLAE